MSIMQIVYCYFFLFVSLLAMGCTSAAKESGFKNEGKTQSEVKANFVDVNNRVVALDSLRDKVVVMNFWAIWCIPCIRELPALNALFVDLKSNTDIVFMAVDIDGNSKVASKFMGKNKFELPVYTLHGHLPDALRTKSIPMTVILDKKGKVAVKVEGMVDFSNEKIKEGLLKLAEEK